MNVSSAVIFSKFAFRLRAPVTSKRYTASLETSLPFTVQFTNLYPSFAAAVAVTSSPALYFSFTGLSVTDPFLSSFAFTVTVNVSTGFSFSLKFAVSSVFFSTVNLYVAPSTVCPSTVQSTNSYPSVAVTVAVTSSPALYFSFAGLSVTSPMSALFAFAVTVNVSSTGGSSFSFTVIVITECAFAVRFSSADSAVSSVVSIATLFGSVKLFSSAKFSPASVCIVTFLPVRSTPSTLTWSFLSFTRSVFTTATYSVPSSPLLAIAEYAFVPFAKVSTCSNSVPTTFVPLEKELANSSNTFAEGVEKKRKFPSPVP